MKRVDLAGKTPKQFYLNADCYSRVLTAGRKLHISTARGHQHACKTAGSWEHLIVSLMDQNDAAFFSISSLQTGFLFHLAFRLKPHCPEGLFF
jgi:hypothetical protein